MEPSVGIEIRYQVPASAGTVYVYSVQRCADGAFFDFECGAFRPIDDIPPRALVERMAYHGGVATAGFAGMDVHEAYHILIHDRDGRVVAERSPVPGHWRRVTIDPARGGRPGGQLRHLQHRPRRPDRRQVVDARREAAGRAPAAAQVPALKTPAPRPSEGPGLPEVDTDAVDALVLHELAYHDAGSLAPGMSFEQLWDSVWDYGVGIGYSKHYVQGHVRASLDRLWHKGLIGRGAIH
jgi:hypothetical protein